MLKVVVLLEHNMLRSSDNLSLFWVYSRYFVAGIDKLSEIMSRLTPHKREFHEKPKI